jgi:hypothetical protein
MGLSGLLRRWLPAALLLAMIGCTAIASSPTLTAGAVQTLPGAGPRTGYTVESHQSRADQVISNPSSGPRGSLCADDGQSAAKAEPDSGHSGHSGEESAPGPTTVAVRRSQTPPRPTSDSYAGDSLRRPAGLLLAELSVRRI